MSKRQVVLIEGDGIGPEISAAVRDIVDAAEAPIEWVAADAGLGAIERTGHGCPQETIERIKAVGVALKGPTTTPVGGGHKSVNVTIRKALELFANVRPSRTLPGVKAPIAGVDLIIVRENIEDTYGGIEHMQSNDVAQCLRLITRPGSKRIARYAFEMAAAQQRKKVTCVHKANIMKITDGLFMEMFYEVAKEYPQIEASDIIVDNCCMQLVSKPGQFDVMVLPNLFGDIVSDLCAGLVGGLGVAPGGNIGDGRAVFEAVHGSAPDIAGKNMANPTAMLLSTIAMLRHMGFLAHADMIERAVIATLESGKRTRDLGGELGTREFAEAVCRQISQATAITGYTVAASAGSFTRAADAVTSVPAGRALKGFDFFVEHTGIPAMPAKVGPFDLKMVSNRGSKVFPGPTPDIVLVDVHRVRYEAAGQVSDGDVMAAVAELDKSFKWMHIEKLQDFCGKAGYSLAQGQ
ncbi:MAG: isocitrate/isopropylmalate family dehydrogenase [Candidatus Sumerlaeia bacterium]|nr:isocitrate/isopropylmalate family dehydrogenase [Candidatus Sumerlaeia bacterium]